MKKQIKNKTISDFTDKKIIDLLDRERRKYTAKNKEKMKTFVDELVKRKVYPPIKRSMKKNKMTALRMVECYGAKWHLYAGMQACPHCKEDLRDFKNGPPFKREIGFYDLFEDRTVELVCPKCYKGLIDGKQYFMAKIKAKKAKKITK